MGTSFVEYKGFGFWTRDSFLESWLRALLDQMQRLPKREPWQEEMMEHWRAQAVVDSGDISLNLDKFLTDRAREDSVRILAQEALERSDSLGYRTGQLFIDLLAGRLKTTVSSPIDYLKE